MRRVLFVCLGNICRSPTAEYVFRKIAAEAGHGARFEIESAGTHAFHVGGAADGRSTAAAAKRGYDLSPHTARRVAPDDFERFDHVFAMDGSNLANLRAACPKEHLDRVEPFMKYARSFAETEVPDPYYGEAGFDRVLDLVEDASRGFLAHLAESDLL